MELTWVRRLSHSVLPVVWRIVLKFDAQGHQFVPKEGPLIATANHVNIIDPFLVDENVGRVMIYFIKEELHTQIKEHVA